MSDKNKYNKFFLKISSSIRILKIKLKGVFFRIFSYFERNQSFIYRILNRLLKEIFSFFISIFKSIDIITPARFVKWIGLSFFCASVISVMPSYFIGPELKEGCVEYVSYYKTFFLITRDLIIDLSTLPLLKSEIQILKTNHIETLASLKSVYSNTIDSLKHEHLKNIKDVMSVADKSLKDVQNLYNMKQSYLENEIQRLNNLQIESIKETSKLNIYNKELMTALAKTKEVSIAGQIGAVLGIVNSVLGCSLGLKSLFWSVSPVTIDKELADTLDYLKDGIDKIAPTIPSTPVFENTENPSSTRLNPSNIKKSGDF